MPTGYKIAGGADIDTLFTAGTNGGTTGYKVSGGADVGAQFNTYVTGAKRAATGFKNSAGTDFSDLFQNSSVPLAPPVHNPMQNMDTYWSTETYEGDDTISLVIERNGQWTVAAGRDNWAVTPAVGVGDSVWVKFTVLTVHFEGNGGHTASTGVLSLNTNRTVSCFSYFPSGTSDVTYRIQLYSDAGGTNLISQTDVRLSSSSL